MKGTHLTLDDRKTIQHGLEIGLSKAQIAKDIGKDPSTISKEIKLHRKFRLANHYGRGPKYFCINNGKFNECLRCTVECENYVERQCKRRDRIGVCNLCPNNSGHQCCFLDKYFYSAKQAHEEYLYTLKDSREGVNLTSSEMITMAETFGPLFKKGQSVYQVLTNHPEFNISVKTLYNYIEAGIFSDFGINNFSLRRQVSMRKRKNLKPRKSFVNYAGHTYTDYLEYKKANPSIQTTEMDTVYNSPEGPYIQTFIFENTELMIGFLHKEKTSQAMASTLDYLENILGDDYGRLFTLLLTDRGSEFGVSKMFEINSETGVMRSNIFYCDPQMPSQKSHVENNHNMVRFIIPNGKRLDEITQNDLNMVFSHINSAPRGALNGKTPYEAFSFFYGHEILDKLNISKIENDDVTLMPYLIGIK